TAWYGVQPKTSRIGFLIAPLFAERRVQNAIERRPQPATNYLQFPSDAAFYRLIYKAEQTEYTALVVAARTRAELAERVKILEAGTASCETLKDQLCVALPKVVGVNLLFPVVVNGKTIMAQWGTTVGGAIREAGERQTNSVLPQLAVHKPYHGRPAAVEFDRASPAILNLILTGGETISWK